MSLARLVSLTAACFALPAAAAAANPDPALQPRIFDGTPAQTCQWPTTVLVTRGGSLCSGTLVSPWLVTTAAHCLTNASYPSAIKFGERNNAPAQSVPVDFCMRNPDYNGDVGGTDSAFCKLAQRVDSVPITPPVFGCETDILTQGREVAIVGFGNNVGNSGAGTKRWSMANIESVVNSMSTQVLVGDTSHAACSGDSGGPAYVQYPDGSWHAFGITSGGPPCGMGGDQYVLIHSATEWIEAASGVDITPCHDVDGTWNPTVDCRGFSTDPLDTSVTWADWCPSATSGFASTCGEGFDAVPDDTPPIVEITSPVPDTVFEGAPATFDIEIAADDGDGWGIREVRIRVDGMELAVSDASLPYGFDNAQFDQGGYLLQAVAEDWAGNIGESPLVPIGVDAAPPELPDDGETGDSGSDESDTDDGGGPSGDGPGDDGCGCSAGGSTPGGGIGLLIGSLIGFRRRRAG